MATKERSLSKAEARLVLEMEWRKQRTISLNEIQALLGVKQVYARFVAYRLVQKRWFERLRRGVFQLIPAERGREAIADTSPFVANEIFPSPCFYSFGSACSYYGFTEQAFAEMYLVSSKKHTAELVREKKYVFAYTPQSRFFGFEKIEIFGCKVEIATPERAILDALDRPEYAGGISEVSRIVRKAAPKLDFKRLLEFARTWNQSALVQRLGYLLDLNQIKITKQNRNELKRLVNPNNKIHLAARRRWNATTHLNTEWHIIENVPKEILLEKTEGTKRPFIFRKGRIK